jgi:leucyl aminopeptidase
MQNGLLDEQLDNAVPLTLVEESQFPAWLENQPQFLKRWVEANAFTAKPNTHCLVSGTDGSLTAVIVGIQSRDDRWALAGLPRKLPIGNYYIETDESLAISSLEAMLVGWGLGAYQFTRYKKAKREPAGLVIHAPCHVDNVQKPLQAINLVRDLINTPAEDMMPQHLAEEMKILGQEFGADVKQIVGEDLLKQNYPIIHAVGRASVHPPRLIDLRWGDPNHPKLTLIGKGVCFDSGGLDLKTSSGMRQMKKDMGGAAHAIGLAHLIMNTGLPVQLRVLVAAVENAVAGNAFHPGDVLRSRQGLTVEIHNTDAEGRLILCDALTEAASENPDLMMDFATLTGAARVALGTEVPALFCNSDELAMGLMTASQQVQDPLWRLPLHSAYRDLLDSKIADITNAASSPLGGAITAALFLQEFVPPSLSWAHFDLMAWNSKNRPGRPEGGEAMGMQAVFHYLTKRFGG